MSDNYIEETKPLFKQLKTEAFRFVVVRYNHYSFVQQLERDLQSRFPERPCSILRANETTYKEVTETFFEQKKGFLIIEGFDDLLQDDKFDAKNDARRKDITIGLNLRRDKLAKFPIALFVCVPATAGKLYAKTMMEKMPDLWSFRSLMLDFEKEIIVQKDNNTRDFEVETKQNTAPVLSAEHLAAKEKELKRLEKLLANTPEEEIAYRLTLYPQIVVIQKEIGLYQAALNTLEDFEEIAGKNEKADIWVEKGDILDITGQIEKAQFYFKKAKKYFDNNNNKADLAVCYERLGSIQSKLGNLEKALVFFLKQNNLARELYQAFPNNVDCKNLLAISYSNLGDIKKNLGNLKEALTFYQKYNSLAKELCKNFPNSIDFKNNLAISYERLGNIQNNLDNLQEALLFYQEQNSLLKELCKDFPNSIDFKNNLAISYERLGSIQRNLGNLQEALLFFREYNNLEKELYSDFLENIRYKNNLAISYSRLGDIQSSLGNLQEVLPFYQKSSNLSKELYKAFPNNVVCKDGLAMSYLKLGGIKEELRNVEEALIFFQEGKKIYEELYQLSPNYVTFKQNLVFLQAKIDKLTKS